MVSARTVGVACVLPLLACAATPRRDPTAVARAVASGAAAAIERRDVAALDARIRRATTPKGLSRRLVLESESRAVAEVVAHLKAAANGGAAVTARARARGPLGVEVVLSRQDGAWRVDPDSLGAPLATPVAAIEQLILTLERMESDPALAIVTGNLRDSIVRASRDRIRGLREALPSISRSNDDRLDLRVTYGEGLFIDLRREDGSWRVEDFN